MPYIKTRDGTDIYVKDWGQGRPVILIHGWPLSADSWDPQMMALADAGFRAIAYDRRGFGRSDQPWAGYDYDTLASDLAAVLEHLDVTGATLIGFSMGGGEVVRYLAKHGDARVAKLVLAASVVPYLLKMPDNPEGVEKSVFDGMVDGLTKDRPGFLAPFGKVFFGAGLLNFSVSSELVQWAGSLALQGSPKATLDCVRSFSETDFRADCAAVKVPTLIIHGDADQTVPLDASSKRAATMIAGAKLIVYPGAPHALVLTEAERFNADVLHFIG